MLDLIAEADPGGNFNWMYEIVKLFLPAILSFLAVLGGLWVWHLKKRSESKYQAIEYLNRKRLDSLMKFWSLLAYMTFIENPKSVIIWERIGNKEVYYLRPDRLREYIQQLSEIFYGSGSGSGLLLERNTKKLLYEFRNQLYGVLLSQKAQDSNEPIKIDNEKLIERLKNIYDELNAELSEERKKIED